jgi:hypothetical protein
MLPEPPFRGASFNKLREDLKQCGDTPRSESENECSMYKFVAMSLKDGEDILKADFKKQV